MDRIRVLAADDNPLVRKQLEAFLNGKDDLELVGVAEDGTGALEIMREKPVDVLLLDMVMPKMDGFSVLKEMNTLDLVHKPHVIVITALMRDDFIQRALSLGVDYYMLKPFDTDLVYQRIRELGGAPENSVVLPVRPARGGGVFTGRTHCQHLSVHGNSRAPSRAITSCARPSSSWSATAR